LINMNDVSLTDTDAAESASCCGGGVSRLDHGAATELATAFSALADPVRLQMLSIIASSSGGEVCACDFVGPIKKSQPTISHHLKVLSEVGLVTGEKRGRWVWYRLTPGRIGELISTLGEATADLPDGAV
jgi:ArsR family transcriptional regulator